MSENDCSEGLGFNPREVITVSLEDEMDRVPTAELNSDKRHWMKCAILDGLSMVAIGSNQNQKMEGKYYKTSANVSKENSAALRLPKNAKKSSIDYF